MPGPVLDFEPMATECRSCEPGDTRPGPLLEPWAVPAMLVGAAVALLIVQAAWQRRDALNRNARAAIGAAAVQGRRLWRELAVIGMLAAILMVLVTGR